MTRASKVRSAPSRAARTAWRAHQWVKDNPDGWHYAVTLALNEARQQCHFSMAWVMAQVRQKDFSTVTGESFKVDNTLTPALARILVKEHPEVKPFMEFRNAGCDGLV